MNLSNNLRGVVRNRAEFCKYVGNQQILSPRIGSTFTDIQLLLAFLRRGHRQGGFANIRGLVIRSDGGIPILSTTGQQANSWVSGRLG
jgi:hypothetical protein